VASFKSHLAYFSGKNLATLARKVKCAMHTIAAVVVVVDQATAVAVE
jgi:hypothetical protein